MLAVGESNASLGGLPLPFDAGVIGWAGCTVYVAPIGSVGLVHSNGSGSVPLPIPNDPLLAGFTFHAQAASLDPGAPNGAVAFSAAVEVIVN